MSEVKVIGHVNPDTDSTCSPIVYAWYLAQYHNMSAEAVLAGDVNKEARFILERYKVNKPEIIQSLNKGDKIVIVDTNNPEELVSGYEGAEIVEIIDHHKLVGGLSTESPIRVTIKPIACTATLLWQRFLEEGNSDIPKSMAGLLLCAILSDTLKFSSPTTTEEDKAAAEKLAEICGENIDELATAMFDAKSDLSGMSAEDIIKTDSKVFDFGDKKVRISVLETVKPENAMAMLEDIKIAMQDVKSRESLNGVLFYLVDIIKNSSDVIVIGEFEKNVVEKGYSVTISGDRVTLPGVVSRKKQMVPNIEKALA